MIWKHNHPDEDLLFHPSACAEGFFMLGDVWILSRFAPENYSYQSGQSYFPYDELRQVGLFDTPIADASGKYYRMPTSGELQMIFPQVADTLSSGSIICSSVEFRMDSDSGQTADNP